MLVRKPEFWGVILVATATCMLFSPVFRGDVPLPTRSIPGLTWGQPDQPAVQSIFRDRIVQAYPYHLFAAEEIQSGRWPLWNHLIFNGTTFFANGQAGVLSLLKLPWWWLPPIDSYIVVTLLQSFIAACGVLLLGRKLGWRTQASVVAALTLTLSAPFVMRMTVTTMSAVIAILPFVLWSILRLHEQLDRRRVALAAVLIAVMIFSGHVQLSAFSLGFAVLWSLIWWRREQWRRRGVYVALVFILGLGLSAVQLLPVKESLGQAYRQPAHRSWSTVLNPQRLFAVNIKQAASLATMIDHNALGNESHYRGPGNYLEGNLYIGPLALIAVLASAWAWRKRWWRWIAGVAVLIGGLYIFPGWWDVVGKIAPWITVTPVWRTSFMFVVAITVLAGIGAHEGMRRYPRLAWSFVGVMVVTMLWQWWGILPFASRSTLFPADPLLTTAAQLTKDGTTLWTPNGVLDQLMPYGIPVAMGYDSVYSKRYLELWSSNAELRQRNQLHVKDPSAQLLAVSGANVMLTSDPIPVGWTAVTTSGYWALAKKDAAQAPIHAAQRLLPEVSTDQISTIDPTSEALISGDAIELDPSAKAVVTVLDRTASELRLHVAATGATAVITNLQQYPGWNVVIDNQPQERALITVNHAFIGALVPAGEHDVTIQYQPKSIVRGAQMSILTLLVILGLVTPRRFTLKRQTV